MDYFTKLINSNKLLFARARKTKTARKITRIGYFDVYLFEFHYFERKLRELRKINYLSLRA